MKIHLLVRTFEDRPHEPTIFAGHSWDECVNKMQEDDPMFFDENNNGEADEVAELAEGGMVQVGDDGHVGHMTPLIRS